MFTECLLHVKLWSDAEDTAANTSTLSFLELLMGREGQYRSVQVKHRPEGAARGKIKQEKKIRCIRERNH
jgi:hypothetical protein